MIDLNDPDMREIVIDFCDESDELLETMRDLLESFEDNPSQPELLEQFGQVIDRIMGAAKTLGAAEIGHLCQMGKIIGYKSAQAEQTAIQEVAGGVLLDLCDFLEVMLTNVRDNEKSSDFNYEAFTKRLSWLADKLKHINRSSCSFDEEEAKGSGIKTTTVELDKLIAQFGKV
jgi:chemotaxis protein histidine kinase CheA